VRSVFEGRTAIVGIGATGFSRESGRSELSLAAEATKSALDDAGLSPADVDGLVTYTVDGTDEIDLARTMGMGDLTYFSRTPHGGGGACATVQQAAMAVATEVASVVVCYRALNGRSGKRLGAGGPPSRPPDSGRMQAWGSWYNPFGLTSPAQRVAMVARRYMHESGATGEDFGRVSVICRKHAATNPAAIFHGRPITLQEHQASRWVVEPLRLLDCCLETDGGVALVVTSLDRARDLRQRPALIQAAAMGSAPEQESMSSYYRSEVGSLPEMAVVGRQLWQRSALRPEDIQVGILYDHFTPYVLMQLEALGFCARGEARHFLADGQLELTGSLPLNPNGGQLGEAYVHGLNGIAEGVRQVRGTAVNQVPDVAHVLVTAGTGVPTSALVLGVG
jgi:acetyl-CoA acetyltransferase